jgi:hypothetical protein
VIGYHYSPATNAASIAKHGLLVPLRHPKLTTPVVCSEGHRNPHISLARTPSQAWALSGGFLIRRAREQGASQLYEFGAWWNLYQVDLKGIRYSSQYEIAVRVDIPKSRVAYVGSRFVT